MCLFMAMDNKISTVFGLVLRDLRRQKKLTQEQLADLSGRDRTYVSLLERGLRQPTIETLFAFAKALEMSPDKIIKILVERYNEN